jgi:hypothetical protein
MSKGAFKKFIDVKPSGAKKKEKLKQEKRSVKKEREAFFDNQKREQRKAKKEAIEQRQFFEQTKRGIKPVLHTKPIVRGNAIVNDNDAIKKPNPTISKFSKENTDKEPKPQRKRIYADDAKFNAAAGKKSFYKSKETIEAEKKAIFESNKKTKRTV